VDEEYWRWLYTAVTRARRQLFLIACKEEWFESEGCLERAVF
jgi:ATP-dependent exoDNAse (exonuclease V) beta subunit